MQYYLEVQPEKSKQKLNKINPWKFSPLINHHL